MKLVIEGTGTEGRVYVGRLRLKNISQIGKMYARVATERLRSCAG